MKKRLIACMLGVTLVALYLMFANTIVVSIWNTTNKMPFVREVDEVRTGNTKGFGELQSWQQKMDIFRTFELSGLVAVPTEKDNSNKSAVLILKNSEKTYEIDGYFIHSGDLNDHFSTYGLRGIYHLMKVEFSTIPIKNGIYSVLFYDRENDSNDGLIDMSFQLEKRDDGLYEYIPPECDPIDAQVDDRIRWAAFSNSGAVSGGYYGISGLVMKENTDSRNLKAYVEAVTRDGEVHTFPARLLPHSWFNSHYNSSLYTYSAIYVKIPVELLLGKEVQINFIVDDAGTMSKMQGYYFAFDETGYNRVFTECIDMPSYGKVEVGDIAHIQWNGLENAGSESHIFNGIAFVRNIKLKAPKIYLRFEYEDGSELIYPTGVSENDWVKKNYGEDYKWSQYYVEVSKKDFRHETTKLYICVGDGDVIYQMSEPIIYMWEENGFVKSS